MIQEALNLVYTLVFIYHPSYVSAVYLLLGSYLWLNCTFLQFRSVPLYKFGAFFSSAVLVLRGVVIFSDYLGFLVEIYEVYTYVFESLGFAIDTSSISIAPSLIPDGIALAASLISLLLAWRECLDWTHEGVLKYLGLASLMLATCLTQSLVTVFYTLIILYWVIIGGLFLSSPNYNYLSRGIAVVTNAQLLLTLAPLEDQHRLGYIPKESIAFMLNTLVLVLFSSMARTSIKRKSFKYKDLLDLENEPSLSEKFAILLLYFVGKVCLFLWLNNVVGFAGLVQLFWIGFTLLEPGIYTSMRATKYLLMPVLILSYTLTYIASFWKQTRADFQPLMLLTIVIFAYFYNISPRVKNIQYSLPATWYGKIASLVLANSYLFSLTVLFIIGLSTINLFHTGLMILCLVYMSNVENVRKHWHWLIVYTLLMIFIRYTWVLVNGSIFHINAVVLDIIGLSNAQEDNEFRSYNYLIWVLLLCSSLQQFANNYLLFGKFDDYKNVVFNALGTAYSYFSNIEFWLLYIVLFVFIGISHSNIPNLLRYLILLWIVARHLRSPRNHLSLNFSKQNNVLAVLKIYSMIILAIRYIYQFLPYFIDESSLPDLRILGLSIYDKQNLYDRTFKDTTILIVSVLAHRSNTYWLDRDKAKNTPGENSKESKESMEAKKNKPSVRTSVFYNFFSRPFQYIVFLTIASLCIFWKLSLSMLIYLFIIGVYEIHMAFIFRGLSSKPIKDGEKVKQNKRVEWQARATLWSVMFYMTLIFLLLAFVRHLADTLLVDENLERVEVAMFIAGFSSTTVYMLGENFGYLIILVALVIERHCLLFMIPKKLQEQENGWKEGKRCVKNGGELEQSLIDRENEELDENFLKRNTARCIPKDFDTLVRRTSCPTAPVTYSKFPLSDNVTKVFDKVLDEYTYESVKKEINYISTLTLLKVLSESLIPALLLALAFYKLTIVSVVYVLFVLLMLLFNSTNRICVLHFVLIICIWAQYGVILSNISNEVSPGPVPEALHNTHIPWYSELHWYSSQAPIFLNLGVLEYQFTSIFYDLLIEIFILIYYFYLSIREKQLEKLQKTLSTFQADDIQDEEADSFGFKAKLKQFLFYIKLLFYKFARFSIVIIVLLFITQSVGVLSALYCLFCLVFIFRENSILISDYSTNSHESRPIEKSIQPMKKIILMNKKLGSRKKTIEEPMEAVTREDLLKILSYARVLGYFIGLIAFDLTLQIVVQSPSSLFNKDQDDWYAAVGIFKLWKDDEGHDVQDNEDRYNNIMFKIFTFTILLAVHAMMSSEDFQISHQAQCKIIEKQSRKIALKMSHEFNRQRICMSTLFARSKKLFNYKLKKLEENIEVWNYRFNSVGNEVLVKSNSLNMYALDKQQTRILPAGTLTSAEPQSIDKGSATVIRFLIDMINQSLFSEFIKRITVISSVLPDRKERLAHEARMKKIKKEFYGADIDSKLEEESLATDSEEEDQRKKQKQTTEQFPKSKKKIVEIVREYDFNLRDYPALIVYVFASNTQSLVYFSFFLNHFMYASLESLVFPLSILCYSMLEYPRPKVGFFRIMLFYAEVVFFIKFVLQLQIWSVFDWSKDFLEHYKDEFKTGFNRADHTYSETLFYYVLWDVVLMFCLLLREYYMLRIGMWHKTETDIESLSEAKIRLKKSTDTSGLDLKDRSHGFFDLYLFTIMTQLLIFCYLFFFFNRMDGSNQDITESLKSNQFQGRMVVAMLIVVIIMLLERYQYLKHISRALQDAADAAAEAALERKTKKFERISIEASPDIVLVKRLSHTYSIHDMQKENDGLLSVSSVMDMNQGMSTMVIENEQKKVNREKERNYLLIIKLILHGALVIIVHFVVFWYFPLNGNYENNGTMVCEIKRDLSKCNNFEINPYLQGFYVLYLIYLVLASQQIRFGLPSFTKISFPLMRHISSYSSGAFKVYRGAPFLFEVRTLIDWTFTKTTLNIYQWFKLEDIHAQLFTNQCTQKSLSSKKPGEEIGVVEKCQYGVMGLLCILLIILLPLFLFSTLNPIFESNKVKSASVSLKLMIDTRVYNIYSTSAAESIEDIGELWHTKGLKHSTEITPSDQDLMQVVEMPMSADYVWDITPSRRDRLEKDLRSVMEGKAKLTVLFDYSFRRKYPESFPIASLQREYSLNSTHAEVLYGMVFNDSGATLDITELINRIIRLPSAGANIIPIIIVEKGHQKDLVLNIVKNNSEYWEFGTHDENGEYSSFRFFTISENYSPITFDFSILTFYISIVYVAGRLLRLVTYGTGMNVVMTDMKDPEHLNTLCAGVYVSRMIGNLKKEEELYYELLDILRSPEMTKALTGKSSIKNKEKDE